jgi:glycerophosphoryl diester phosphodiesterase
MKILFVSLGVIILLYLLMIMPRMRKKPDKTRFLSVFYAHRGLHDNESDAPENSMKAFFKAVKAGYGIELDVQLTKDKIPVVFHDSSLQRMCHASGNITDYTYLELQSFTLGKSEEKIPKLEEVLNLVAGRVPLIVEYKAEHLKMEICEISDRLLQNYKGYYSIESFNPKVVFWYRTHRREIMRGILSDAFSNEPFHPIYPFLQFLVFNFLSAPDFVAYNHKHYKNLSRMLCRNLYGCTSVAWTIKSQKEIEERRKDFDAFIFDSFIPK